MNGQVTDPYRGFRFRIEINGLIVGGFSEVTGIQRETQVEEIREGGVNNYVHRLPRETKYPNLVLKRGLTASEALWMWHEEVVSGRFARRTVHVILLDSEGKDVWRWSFENAYPAKWTGADLKADTNAVAFESIELVHTGFARY
jgi:phage tail-like protein